MQTMTDDGRSLESHFGGTSENEALPNGYEESQSAEDEQFADDVVIVKDDTDESGNSGGSIWSSYLSHGFGQKDNNEQIWNVNELFRIGLRLGDEPSKDDQEMSLLDEDAKKLLSNVEASQELQNSRIRELLRRLLGMDSPRLTDHMLDFFMMDGVVEQFMRFLTRLDPIADPVDWSNLSPALLLEALRPREKSKEEPQKYAYNVTEVLANISTASTKLLDTKLREIVIRAFDIFSPMSDGNFHHLCKLMESLLVREKSQVLDILLMTMPNQKPFPTDSHEALTTPIITKPLIFRCILYLQESPVCQIIIRALFSVPMETEEQIQAQKFRYACLQQEGFIESLIDIVLLNQDQEILKDHIVAAADMLIRLIEEACDVTNANILFMSLEGDSSIIKRCSEMFFAPETPAVQQDCIISILHAFCCKSTVRPARPIFTTETLLVKEKSTLLSVSTSSCRYVLQHIKQLTEFVNQWTRNGALQIDGGFKVTSHEVTNHLSARNILLLEILASALQQLPDESPVLDEISSVFWRNLVDWFFEFKYNNTYHALFFRMFQVVLSKKHKVTLKNLLSKTRLIPRMVEHYQLPPHETGARGYMILMFNILRLTAESQNSNDYIAQLLFSSHEWKEFWPKLKEDTVKQVVWKCGFPASFKARPVPHLGPTTIQLLPSESTETPPGLPRRPDDVDADEGVHLGSTFALALGFPLPKSESEIPHSPVSVKKKKRKKKRKSSLAAQSDLSGDEVSEDV